MKIKQFLSVLILLMLCACSSSVQKTPVLAVKSTLEQELSGELILGRPYLPEELPNADLFGLTPEMKQFAEQATQGINSVSGRAEALHKALMTSVNYGGRGITYSAQETITGIDAFEQRQANCLSYTLLYVAMARHVNLKAEVNEVILPPTWNMRATDTYLLMRHVNAKVFLPRPSFNWVRVVGTADINDIVVDLEMRRFRPHYKQQVIDKPLIAAQFYSNRGMELAAEGKTQEAFLYLRKALSMSQEPSYIWSNFGSFYRRLGLLPQAEKIYLHGLKINPRDHTIMHNLAGVYRDLGNEEASNYYQQRVRQHRNANPYFMFKRAEDEVKKGDYQAALVLIKKAISKESNESRFYTLAASIYDALGEAQHAQDMRDKVYQLSTIRY
jgi:Flp pilus assembly protein TadD